MLDCISKLIGAVPASPSATAIASRLVLWVHTARFGLVTTFFFAYRFCDKETALLFTVDFTTFTPPFETDLG